MTSERTAVTNLATWIGGQLKAVRTYADQSAASAAAQVKNEILGGASAAYDTLQEIKAIIDAGQANDQSALSALTTALAKRVRVDAAQTLTVGEQAQARANIDAVATADLGATEVDYVAVATAAMS